MQNNFYKIKERIKEIAVNKGIPLGKFFKEIGVSSTGFSGEKLKKGVNSETIQKIFSMYPDTDLHWLITGETKKEISTKENTLNDPEAIYSKNQVSIEQLITDAVKQQTEDCNKQLHKKLDILLGLVQIDIELHTDSIKKAGGPKSNQ